jgi:putative transposase
MARPKHITTPLGTYFITTSTWQRRALFNKAPWAEVVVEKLFAYRDAGEYFIHAYVVMPDHFHMLLTPDVSATLERAVKTIKGGSSREIGVRFGTRFPVWQPGFTSHIIRDERDYEVHVVYIHQNPVKRGLVGRAEDYAFGSANGKRALDTWKGGAARAGL